MDPEGCARARALGAALLLALLALLAPGLARAEPASDVRLISTSSSTADATIDPWTTELHPETDAPPNPALLALSAPATLVELAFAPLIPVFLGFEKLRLHERLFDLLTNEERTLAIVPIFDLVNRSGFSGGVGILNNDPLGSPDRTVILGLIRENGDRTLSFSFTRRLAFLSGRRVHLGAAYRLDQDARYFGVGSETRREDRHALSLESEELGFWLELPAPSEWSARIEGGLTRRVLGPGTGDDPALTRDTALALPAGFEEALTYPQARVAFEYDSRDSNSRPGRGFVTSLSGTLTRDLEGRDTGALTGAAQLGTFIPLLPIHRVLVLTFGAAAATTFPGTREVPYHALVNLGGSRTLRGYETRRFLDRLGWWATAEYRYKLYEYGSSGNGLSATLFADTGRVGRKIGDLLEGPLAWSVGFGLRAELNLFFLGRLQLAWSPEGPRVVIAVNGIL